MSQSYESVKKYLPYFFDVTTNYYYSNPNNKQKILDGGNEMRPSVKEGKYKIFTFADRHRERETNMKIFKNKVEKYSIIDEVNVFNLSDVDSEYIKQNQSLFDDNRIFPWAAKAYLMYKGLQDCDDGDVIFWIDSDVIDLKEDGVENLFNLANNSEKGIVGFHSDWWLERLFTKSDLYRHFNITDSSYWDTNQAYGGIFLVKKNEYTIKFFQQLFDTWSIIRLMDYSPSRGQESVHFIKHQNDQSILSLLYKIHNIKTFPLPLYDLYKTNIIGLDSGYFEEGVVLPIIWESCWHGLSYKQMWINCNSKFGKSVSPPECLSMSTDNYEL